MAYLVVSERVPCDVQNKAVGREVNLALAGGFILRAKFYEQYAFIGNPIRIKRGAKLAQY
jgi:hypothetical protein